VIERIEGRVEGAVSNVEGKAPALQKAIDGVLDQSDQGPATPKAKERRR
jgi:hypothetical protein